MRSIYLTVVETDYYYKRALKLLSTEQLDEVVTLVASDPEIGEVMKGTGGVRKFRYASKEGRGKSGGARIIHLPLTAQGKVYLLDIFSKNEKVNLSAAERQEMAKIVKMMKGEKK